MNLITTKKLDWHSKLANPQNLKKEFHKIEKRHIFDSYNLWNKKYFIKI